MRLAHQDHPFLRIGEIGEVRIVTRIFDVEVDLDVDQQGQRVERLAFDRDPELFAHRAASAVAGEEVRAFEFAHAVRRLEARDHAVVGPAECRQAMPEMRRARLPLLERAMQDRLEMVLRHVDDEGIAGVLAEQLGAHRGPRRVGGALHVADLVDAQAPWPAPGRRRRSGGTLQPCASARCRPWCRWTGPRLPRTIETADRRNAVPARSSARPGRRRRSGPASSRWCWCGRQASCSG